MPSTAEELAAAMRKAFSRLAGLRNHAFCSRRLPMSEYYRITGYSTPVAFSCSGARSTAAAPCGAPVPTPVRRAELHLREPGRLVPLRTSIPEAVSSENFPRGRRCRDAANCSRRSSTWTTPGSCRTSAAASGRPEQPPEDRTFKRSFQPGPMFVERALCRPAGGCLTTTGPLLAATLP